METEQPRNEQRPVAAFAISLIAGLWMLASGGMMTAGYGWGGMNGGYMMGMRGSGGMHTWMWRHGYMQQYWGGAWPTWIGIAAAICVIAGAIAIYAQPRARRAWGPAILIASAVALVTGSGVVPGVLGIVGGILAMSGQSER
jgi:hypothetical protein